MGEATRRLSDGEVYARINQLFDCIESGASTKKRTCQYYTGEKHRPCLATSHDNCANCGFYAPTMQQKMRLVLERQFSLEDEIKLMKSEVRKKDKIIDEMGLQIKILQHRLFDEGGDDDEDYAVDEDY